VHIHYANFRIKQFFHKEGVSVIEDKGQKGAVETIKYNGTDEYDG